ncbi:MAG: Crp/Fnr family transcriptional regulator [Pseudomonadota bacterium]|nr:Crp/Fnr family transcriptional regulator [Pseudomonadota bacterium]
MSGPNTFSRWQQITAQLSRRRLFKAEEVIIHEDDTDDQVYFILSGKVKVTNFSVRGREIWHSDLTAGTIFGEMAALTGSPRSVNITAVDPTRLAILSRQELFDLLEAESDFAIWLLKEMARRLEDRTDKLNAVVAQSLSQRIRAELLQLASGQADGGMVIRPVPNFTELARRLNTDRENVSREISTLTKQGVLAREPDLIRILNRDVLEQSVSI